MNRPESGIVMWVWLVHFGRGLPGLGTSTGVAYIAFAFFMLLYMDMVFEVRVWSVMYGRGQGLGVRADWLTCQVVDLLLLQQANRIIIPLQHQLRLWALIGHRLAAVRLPGLHPLLLLLSTCTGQRGDEAR